MKGGETDGERRKWWRVKGEGRTGSEGGGEGVVVLGFVFVLGRSFTFVGTRLCSWQGHCVWVLVISGWGCCHLWGTVAVPGQGCLWAVSLFVGLGGHLWVPCHCLWVLGVIVGCQAVVWGW